MLKTILLIMSCSFPIVVNAHISLVESDIAVLQFDSRPLDDYWESSAKWNNYYCNLHGHKFIYYTSNEPCRYQNEILNNAWCKVKAMIQATSDFPNIKLFIYMDSDAVISKQYINTSLVDIIKIMTNKLNWNPEMKPIVFNQDGPCWWCNLIKKVGYSMCLNAGTVMWYRSIYSESVLQTWWHMSMDPYTSNPLKRYNFIHSVI